MGRHAAPGDEPDPPAATVERAIAAPVPSPAVARPTPRGRHARVDDDEASVPPPPGPRPTPTSKPTVTLPAAVPEQPEPEKAANPKAEKAANPKAEKDGKEKPSQADLRLLRTDAALRNRVIAAVVVPFVLFVVVLLAIGRLDAFAVWLWLPLITAGVVGGLLLDGAHNRSSGG